MPALWLIGSRRTTCRKAEVRRHPHEPEGGRHREPSHSGVRDAETGLRRCERQQRKRGSDKACSRAREATMENGRRLGERRHCFTGLWEWLRPLLLQPQVELELQSFQQEIGEVSAYLS